MDWTRGCERPAQVRILARVAALALFLAQAADLAILETTQIRPQLDDVLRFRHGLSAVSTMFVPLEAWSRGAVAGRTIGAAALVPALVAIAGTVSVPLAAEGASIRARPHRWVGRRSCSYLPPNEDAVPRRYFTSSSPQVMPPPNITEDRCFHTGSSQPAYPNIFLFK